MGIPYERTRNEKKKSMFLDECIETFLGIKVTEALSLIQFFFLQNPNCKI